MDNNSFWLTMYKVQQTRTLQRQTFGHDEEKLDYCNALRPNISLMNNEYRQVNGDHYSGAYRKLNSIDESRICAQLVMLESITE